MRLLRVLRWGCFFMSEVPLYPRFHIENSPHLQVEKEWSPYVRFAGRLTHLTKCIYQSFLESQPPPHNSQLNVLIGNCKRISQRFCGGVDFPMKRNAPLAGGERVVIVRALPRRRVCPRFRRLLHCPLRDGPPLPLYIRQSGVYKTVECI